MPIQYQNKKLFPGGLKAKSTTITFPFLSTYQDSPKLQERGCIPCECGKCGPCSCIGRCGDKMRAIQKIKPSLSRDETIAVLEKWRADTRTWLRNWEDWLTSWNSFIKKFGEENG